MDAGALGLVVDPDGAKDNVECESELVHFYYLQVKTNLLFERGRALIVSGETPVSLLVSLVLFKGCLAL